MSRRRNTVMLMMLLLITAGMLFTPGSTATAQTCVDEDGDGRDDTNADFDGDGVDNCIDQCPAEGESQYGITGSGCPLSGPPDDDADGIPNDRDNCPNEGIKFNVTEDGCPIPLDSDNDGVPDNQDACPNQGDQGFGLGGDGCPMPAPAPIDMDMDGIPDDQDACPNQGDQGFGLGDDGCPMPAPAPIDTDVDGIPDDQDVCPNQGDQGFGLGGDGCPLAAPPADTSTDSITTDTDTITEPITEPEPIPEVVNTEPVACSDSANYLPGRLTVNGSGKLVTGQNTLNLRSSAGTNSTVLGSLAPVDTFEVLEGPLCNQEGANYYRWWRVQVNGNPSWLAESDGFVYYVEPVVLSAPVAEPVASAPTAIDSDGDGVVDSEDICPDQEDQGLGFLPNGCPIRDFDQDGFQDSEDACPVTFGVAPDGCPVGDNDIDPVTGEKIICTNQFDGKGDYPRNVDFGFGLLSNGCPITDIDADEVPDYTDACPDVGDQGFGMLPNGCPLFEGETADNICTSQARGTGHYPRNVDFGFGLLDNGCPITDIDADEVPDGADACPLFGDQGYGVSATGCPNITVATNRGVNLSTLQCLDESLDCDNDGYSNKYDRCPFTGATPGNTTSWVNGRLGCPKTEAELTADVVCGDDDLVRQVVIGCILAFENLKQLPEVNTGTGFDFFHPNGIASPPNAAIGPAALEMCNLNNVFSIELSTEVWSAKVPGSVWIEYCQKSYLLLKIRTADYKVQIFNDELERQREKEREEERIKELARQREAEERWRIHFRNLQLARIAEFNRLRAWEEEQRRSSGFIGGVRTFLRGGGKLVKDIGTGIVDIGPKALGCLIDDSIDKVTFGQTERIKNKTGPNVPGWQTGECTTFQ